MTYTFQLLSDFVAITQIYHAIELQDDEAFKRCCDNILKSRIFRNYYYPDKNIFSLKLRDKGETFRTFELIDPFKIINVNLIKTKLQGKLRVFITIYRCGFLGVSLVHSVISKREPDAPVGKNLISDNLLSSLDLVFLIQQNIQGYDQTLKYIIELSNKKKELTRSDLEKIILMKLASFGICVKENSPIKVTNVIHFTIPKDCPLKFIEVLDKNCYEVFDVFTTPLKGITAVRKKEVLLEKLKSNIGFQIGNRGFLFDSNSMLIISPISKPARRALHTQLPWIYQLVSIADFMVKIYSKELRKLSPRIVLSSVNYYELLSEVSKLRSKFSLCLEDLFWIENDLFRLQSVEFVRKYKKRYNIEEKIDNIETRFDWIQNRCKDALSALGHKAEMEREKNIINLTLVFAVFALGEVISNYIIWAFVNFLPTKSPLREILMGIGIVAPFLAILTIILLSRWYVNKKYESSK